MHARRPISGLPRTSYLHAEAITPADHSAPDPRTGPDAPPDQRIRMHARILDSLGHAVIATDLDGTIVYWNDGAEAMFGIASDEALGANITDVTPAQASREQAREIMERLSCGESWKGRMVLQRSDGSEFPATITDTPVFQGDELVGTVGVTIDLTEEEQALEEREELVRELARERGRLKTLLEQAEEASRIKTEFLSVMSHELRTPLTAVIGFAELMQMGVDGPVSDRQKQRLQRVIENSMLLRDLVDEILEYARAQTDQAELVATWFDAVEIAREAVQSYEPTANRKGLELSFHSEQDQLEVYSDQDRVRRLLMNLVSNATKFTQQGSVRIGVLSNGDWFGYTVQDTGPGMTREEQERAFQAFVQVDQSATRTHGGVGLGLAVVQRISHMLDGELIIDSEPGSGTRIEVRLPRSAEAD